MGLCCSDIEHFAVKGLHWNTQIVFPLVVYIYIWQWVSFAFPIISHLYVICFNFLYVRVSCSYFILFYFLPTSLPHNSFLPLFCSWLPSANFLITAISHICYYSLKKENERKMGREGVFVNISGTSFATKWSFQSVSKTSKLTKWQCVKLSAICISHTLYCVREGP